MGKIGRISSIKRQYVTENGQSLGSSLSDKGYTLFPGVTRGITPYKEKNGKYRTGLDPDALYIAKMSKEEAEQEKARVTSLKEELELLTGEDLSPTSDYYARMFEPGEFGEDSRASFVRLYDGTNTFNLDNPYMAIQYAWLRVHPDIAPSYSAWERGSSSYRCPLISQCLFFVDDEEREADAAYKQKTSINKAINMLETMSSIRRLKVAKLLNLPITYTSSNELVYNELDTYIKATDSKGSKRVSNLNNFMKIAEMADENIEIRYKVKEARDFNVYREGKGGKLYEGEVLVAESEDELIEFLSEKKNQADYLALQKKIENAKIVQIL